MIARSHKGEDASTDRPTGYLHSSSPPPSFACMSLDESVILSLSLSFAASSQPHMHRERPLAAVTVKRTECRIYKPKTEPTLVQSRSSFVGSVKGRKTMFGYGRGRWKSVYCGCVAESGGHVKQEKETGCHQR